LVGTAYRLLVGIGIIGMAISGCMIFFKIRARSRSV
jgi:multidrug transporter EmrE-like cation transporter